MDDLTILMLTLNKLPKGWAEYHKAVLLDAACNAHIITISKEPLDWGTNILQTEEPSVSNIYWQILKGARLATTKYIAIAEDDTLYPREHFEHRPPLDKIAYNMTRWAMFTWGSAFYFYKPRPANGTLIAPRKLLVDLISDEFEKHGRISSARAKDLWTSQDKWYSDFYTLDPVLCLNHIHGVDPLEKSRRKAPWAVRAFEIPRWGRAEDIRRRFV
jgi:hypothetical protein